MHVAGRPVRALFAAGLAILAGISSATLSGQIVAVQPAQAGQTPPSANQPAPEPPKGTGILIGQVIDAGTKRGIQGALVSISSASGAAPQSIVLSTGEIVSVGGAAPLPAGLNDAPRQLLTDATGRFMFRSLAAGRYSIRVSASPYLAGGYGASRPGAVAQTIELTRDDEKRDGIVVRMWKGASINGTVVDEAGEPAIGVGVRAFRRAVSGGRTRLMPSSSGTTDDRGAYRISSLTPGDYFVGVITTSTTMPVATADAFVQVLASGAGLATSELYRDLMSSGGSATMMLDSAGGYRVGDLMFRSGTSYFGSGGAGTPAPDLDERVLTYPSTFYPGAGVIAQATPITLASGEDRTRIDLHLRLLPSMRVSGTVTGPDGPVRNLGVRLLPAGADDYSTDTQIEAASSVTDTNGVFTFLGVTAGSYTFKALRIPRPTAPLSRGGASSMVEVTGPGGMVMGVSMVGPGTAGTGPPPLPTEQTLWAAMPISVGESDIVGLSVMLQSGPRLRGQIVFDGDGDKPTPEQMQQTPISMSPVTTASAVAAVAKRVESDGTFATSGYPPGKYLLSASPPGAIAAKWKFKSATLGGRIVSDEGLDLQGEDVSGLVITFTHVLGEINGTVTNDRGAPDQTSSVVVIPADSTAWKQGVINTRRLRSVRVTTTGAFTFADLAPGAYYVAAIADDLPDNWQLPATLDAITRVAARVVIADAAKVSQTLTSRPIR